MKFKGDIIITDPCYIDTEDSKLWDGDKVDIYTGSGLGQFGFTNCIWEDTIYGDWSCTTFKIKDESANVPISELKSEDIDDETLGEFCADAGMVGVFLLDEVLAFNPDFDYHIERPWTTTLIKDFDGEVEYCVEDYEVFIRGTGNINFITRQTGF